MFILEWFIFQITVVISIFFSGLKKKCEYKKFAHKLWNYLLSHEKTFNEKKCFFIVFSISNFGVFFKFYQYARKKYIPEDYKKDVLRIFSGSYHWFFWQQRKIKRFYTIHFLFLWWLLLQPRRQLLYNDFAS